MPRRTPGSPHKVDEDRHIVRAEEERRASAAPGRGRGNGNADEAHGFSQHINERQSFPTHNSPDTSKAMGANTKANWSPASPRRGAAKTNRPKQWRLPGHASAWVCSVPMLIATGIATLLLTVIIHAFLTRQLDPKGCDMCWSRPIYIKFADFDTEHTRFASKYSLYMIKEGGLDENPQVKGVPVLFIPGNAGSYKQARCLEFESAHYYDTVIQQDSKLLEKGAASLDFFTLDFNEDFSAFHGQTLLDQAEYVNDAIAYILSLYHDPRRAVRDPSLPDPSSVVLIGHSMGGVVARAIATIPNYQSNSVNTIITMSTPHARAPVSVDHDLVHAYAKVNDYWRGAHLQRWASDNPLWHVTLVSIAGGGLDTVVPSDYASLESLVPISHGFTVFTSGIPNVWTGADHIQTTWCVQLMKAIVHSIYDVLDVHRPSQTRPRSDRMRIFKKRYLTGLEGVVEKSLSQEEASILVPLEKNSDAILRPYERLVLRELGRDPHVKTYLVPIPSQTASKQSFHFLSDQVLQRSSPALELLFCSVYPAQAGHSATLLSMNMDFTSSAPDSARLACKNVYGDSVALPASTRHSSYPFDKEQPFTYLHYASSDIANYQFIAIIDKATEPRKGWVVAELAEESRGLTTAGLGLNQLMSLGINDKLPAERSMVTEVHVPALHSCLLAFRLTVGPQACEEGVELFTPLLRQYIEEPFETKFFVNVKAVNISLHGIAPFMPPPLRAQSASKGISLQFWSDPTCNSSVDFSLKVDLAGSMGKLVMRYRLVFAAFPILVVALVLRKQFDIYDDTGVFITFSAAADLCMRSSMPLLFLALSIFAAARSLSDSSPTSGLAGARSNATESPIDFTRNDLLLGSQDPIFWFLVPLFGLISLGICTVLNYTALLITHVFCSAYDLVKARPSWARMEDISGRSIAPGFSPSSPRRRIVTTCVLLLLVSTIIPYQFAFLDAVLVQLLTCVRALRRLRSSPSAGNHNFYNYTHSILILMIWILPINLPVLVVWIHNLAVHWLTPFSSHHNIISIMPYLILVETLTSGRMIPQLNRTRWRYVANIGLFALAVYAAIYGVSYAYMLHHLVNALSAWLVAVHVWGNGGVDLAGVKSMLEGREQMEGDVKKQP